MKAIRVLLADDHAIVLEGLRRVLDAEVKVETGTKSDTGEPSGAAPSTDTSFQIVGEVSDGRSLVAAAEALKPDIIIADISMPLLNGIEAARQIRKNDHKVKIVFLTMHPDVTYAAEALVAGGSAYILKSSAGAEIRDAIREALNNRTYLSPSLDHSVVLSQMEAATRRKDSQCDLTTRQREVLQLIAEGRSGKEAADILGVSARTVEFHKYRLMAALDLHTVAELVQYAVKHGIISPR